MRILFNLIFASRRVDNKFISSSLPMVSSVCGTSREPLSDQVAIYDVELPNPEGMNEPLEHEPISVKLSFSFVAHYYRHRY